MQNMNAKVVLLLLLALAYLDLFNDLCLFTERCLPADSFSYIFLFVENNVQYIRKIYSTPE